MMRAAACSVADHSMQAAPRATAPLLPPQAAPVDVQRVAKRLAVLEDIQAPASGGLASLRRLLVHQHHAAAARARDRRQGRARRRVRCCGHCWEGHHHATGGLSGPTGCQQCTPPTCHHGASCTAARPVLCSSWRQPADSNQAPAPAGPHLTRLVSAASAPLNPNSGSTSLSGGASSSYIHSNPCPGDGLKHARAVWSNGTMRGTRFVQPQ